MPLACWNNAYGLTKDDLYCAEEYMPIPVVDSDFATGIICVEQCPDEFFMCGLFCVPIEAPICNPIIAKKSFDSLKIKDSKLKAGDKEAIHGKTGLLPGLTFANSETGADPVLDAELKIMAEAISSWSDFSYPLCNEEFKGTH